MKSRKIYDEVVVPQDELDTVLKKCLLTHLGIYNYSLELLKQSPSITYPQLREQVFRYIEERKITYLHIQAVQNELYYQYKKFKRGACSQKLISSIQYFTFLVKGYNNGLIQVDETRTQLRFIGHPGHLVLSEPLPALDSPDQHLYVNLSYSSMENQFVLSVFENSSATVAAA